MFHRTSTWATLKLIKLKDLVEISQYFQTTINNLNNKSKVGEKHVTTGLELYQFSSGNLVMFGLPNFR